MVINFDCPNNTTDYIHRVGRTGRSNRSGKAMTFYTDSDKFMIRKLANVLRNSGCHVPKWIFSIK